MYNLGKEEEQLNTVWTRINEDVPEYMKKVCRKIMEWCVKKYRPWKQFYIIESVA